MNSPVNNSVSNLGNNLGNDPANNQTINKVATLTTKQSEALFKLGNITDALGEDKNSRLNKPLGVAGVVITLVVLGTIAIWFKYESISKQKLAEQQLIQQQSIQQQATKAAGKLGDGIISNQRDNLVAVGKIVPAKISNVSAKISGTIEKVFIEEGNLVKKGDVVAVLESNQQVIQLQLSKARLEGYKDEYRAAGISLDLKERDYNRAKSLIEKKLVSVASVELLESGVEQVKATLNSARNKIEVAELDIKSMQETLENTIIRAPFSGRISEVFVSPGESISPILSGGISAKPGVCTIIDPDTMQIEVDVDEEHYDFVTKSDSVDVSFPALPNVTAKAEITHIASHVDGKMGTFKVTAKFNNKEINALSNMAAKIVFTKKI